MKGKEGPNRPMLLQFMWRIGKEVGGQEGGVHRIGFPSSDGGDIVFVRAAAGMAQEGRLRAGEGRRDVVEERREVRHTRKEECSDGDGGGARPRCRRGFRRKAGKGGARAEKGETGWVRVVTATENDGFPAVGPWYFLQRAGRAMSRITSRNCR